MDPQARANFVPFLLQCGEGHLRHLYLDQHIPPIVTTGDGNALFTLSQAFAIDWRFPDGRQATRAEIAEAWFAVKARPDLAKDGGGAFAKLTQIRATEASITKLIEDKIDVLLASLEASWPWMTPSPDEAPPPAQEGLLRIAWACGTTSLPTRWPHFRAAWIARQWDVCATQCRIPALTKTEPKANDLEAGLFEFAANWPSSRDAWIAAAGIPALPSTPPAA